MKSRFSTYRRSLVAIGLFVVCVATSCQTSETSNAQDDVQSIDVRETDSGAVGETPVPISTIEPTREPTTAPTPEAIEASPIDLSSIDPADALEADSLLGLYEANELSPAIDQGDWFTSSFSRPMVFALPESGQLRGVGLGWIDIEIHESALGGGGVVQIVEAVAFSSPSGPRPIGDIGPGTEFNDTATLARGTAIGPNGEMTWRDVVIESLLIPDNFEQPCPFDASVDCIDAPITDSGPVWVQMDTTQRWVAQDFEGGRLYVVVTPDDPEDSEFLDYGLAVAASVTATDRVEESLTRRPLATVGLRATTIPAGAWFHDVGEFRAEFTVVEPLIDVEIRRLNPTFFALREQETDRGFTVTIFQGFVDPELVPLAERSMPLSGAAILNGFEQMVPIELSGNEVYGGRESIWFETGLPADDSPYLCGPSQRTATDPEEKCFVWSSDGWHTYGTPDDPDTSVSRYVESVGALVFQPVTYNDDGFEAEPPFDQLTVEFTELGDGSS